MDGIGGRVRALLAAKEERGPGLDLGNLGSLLRFAPGLGPGGLGVRPRLERGKGGAHTRGHCSGLKVQDPGTLGVFMALGASWGSKPLPHTVTQTHPSRLWEKWRL